VEEELLVEHLRGERGGIPETGFRRLAEVVHVGRHRGEPFALLGRDRAQLLHALDESLNPRPLGERAKGKQNAAAPPRFRRVVQVPHRRGDRVSAVGANEMGAVVYAEHIVEVVPRVQVEHERIGVVLQQRLLEHDVVLERRIAAGPICQHGGSPAACVQDLFEHARVSLVVWRAQVGLRVPRHPDEITLAVGQQLRSPVGGADAVLVTDVGVNRAGAVVDAPIFVHGARRRRCDPADVGHAVLVRWWKHAGNDARDIDGEQRGQHDAAVLGGGQ